jgi:hypothetical protein
MLFHVINVQYLSDIDYLTVVNQNAHVQTTHDEECVQILAEKEMVKKMGVSGRYTSFSFTNLEFKMWLHLKMLIDVDTLLMDPLCKLGYVNVNGFIIDLSFFPTIYHPCNQDLHTICRLIKRRLTLHSDCVMCLKDDNFCMHNTAHLFYANHLESISSHLLYNQLQHWFEGRHGLFDHWIDYFKFKI